MCAYIKMFFSSLKWVIISFLLIFLMHHLYMFLMNTLTVPKIKDLVNKPTQQYNDIYSTLGGKPPRPPLEGEGGAEYGAEYGGVGGGLTHNGGSGGPAPHPQQNINDELSSFLSDLKKNPTSASAKQDFGSSYGGSNEMSYSPY